MFCFLFLCSISVQSYATNKNDECIERRETYNKIKEFKQNQAHNHINSPYLFDSSEDTCFVTHIMFSKPAFLDFDPWAWRGFLEGYNYQEARRLKKSIVAFLHQSIAVYIRDFKKDKDSWLWKHAWKWEGKKSFATCIMDLSDHVFDWLDKYDVTEVGFYPFVFLSDLESDEKARILSQFERALRLAGPSLALTLHPGRLVLDVPYSPGYREETNCMGRFFLVEAPPELDLELYQTFTKVFGTPANLSALCGIPLRKILMRQAYWMTHQFLGGEPRWRLYAVIIDEWMDKRVEISNLIRSQSLLDKNDMEDLPGSFCFKVMTALRFALEFCLQPFSHEKVCIISNDPGTIRFVSEIDPRQWTSDKPFPCLPKTELDKFPLNELNESARNFFKYALPVLERRKDDIAAFFDAILLPEGKASFLSLLEKCQGMKKIFDTVPGFGITSDQTIRFPVPERFNCKLGGQSIGRAMGGAEWGCWVRDRMCEEESKGP